MNIYQILCLVGIPSIGGAVVGYMIKKIRETAHKTVALERGVQALLRDRLYQSYNHYKEKGYAPLYARENFDNMYQQYHSLGSNGVMDDIRKKFNELPVEDN